MNSSQLSRKEDHDELGLRTDPAILKSLRRNEQVLLSAKVYKYNKRVKRQERSILITTKAIYNVCEDSITSFMSIFCITSKIKRRIDITRLTGITISNLSCEFVLHIASEYDYRLACPTKRDKIIMAICQAYCLNRRQKTLPFYFKDEFNLINFTTTEDDKKNGVSKIPQGNAQMLGMKDLRERLEEARFAREALRKNTQTVFNKHCPSEEICLEDFEILKVLGRGSFGKVMLVQKNDTKKLYAMKSMHKEDLIDKKQIEHAKTEKFVLERNDCPFLVSLEFAFQTPEKIFFVMEFKQGGELYHHLKNSRRFDEERAKFYAAEVVLALEYLHKIDVVYRDLKPENVLMDEHGHICVTDFGLSKNMKDEEKSTSIAGTPDYLAPEVLSKAGHGKQVDWWTLGVFIYELMIGLPPFHDRERRMNQIISNIMHKDVHFPTKVEVSEDAQDMIRMLLQKNPDERLGKNGAQEIKGHKWFSNINWEELAAKKTVPPFVPEISDDYDVGNFDKKYIKEDAYDSFVGDTNQSLLKKYEGQFQTFTFNPQAKNLRSTSPANTSHTSN